MGSVAKISRILVIDDEIGISDSPDRKAFLRAVGYYPATGGIQPVTGYPYEFDFHTGQDETHSNSVDAVKAAVLSRWPTSDGKRWTLVLLDVRFGEDENFGFTLLKALREDVRFGHDLPIVMLTSEDEVKKSKADVLRANGFFPKADKGSRPLWNREGLEQRVLRFGLIPDCRGKELLDRTHTTRLLGNSLSLLKVLRDARCYAIDQTGSRILYGETGTGKTELAGYIHTYSNRREGPYVHWFADPANIGLMKGELFGWWDASFTGSRSSQPGKVEEAHTGTFFLDEVANLPTEIQMALLQFRKQDAAGWRTLARVGKFPRARQQEARSTIINGARLLADHRIQIDVMLLTGTKENLEDEVVRNKLGFREDLQNALGTPLRCPRLNDRKEDIPLLFQTFVRRVLTKPGVPSRQFHIESDVLDLLQQRDWSMRGNVRDLERIAEYAAQQLGDFDTIRLHTLPADVLQEVDGRRVHAPVGHQENLKPNEPQIILPDEPKVGSGKLQFLPGGLAVAELEHLRLRAILLEEAAEATRKEDPATGTKGKYQPTVAVSRLMGINVTTTNAKRIIKDILGTILDTPGYLAEAYMGKNKDKDTNNQEKSKLQILREWVESKPSLTALYSYAIGEISVDELCQENKFKTQI